jgi:peptidoglycan/LPS O-acetylase OafA/YrhL
MVQNFSDKTLYGINSPFWSLATESQFYLAYPAFLYLRAKLGMTKSVWLVLTLSLCSNSLMTSSVWLRHSQFFQAFPTNTWIDWVLGAYVAEALYSGRRAFRVSRKQFCVLLLLFIISTNFTYTVLYEYFFASLLAAIFIDTYIRRGAPLNRFENAFSTLGLCSYSFYLWHVPLMTFLAPALHKLGLPASLAADMTISLALIFLVVLGWSWLLYRTVELGSMAYGRKLNSPNP